MEDKEIKKLLEKYRQTVAIFHLSDVLSPKRKVRLSALLKVQNRSYHTAAACGRHLLDECSAIFWQDISRYHVRTQKALPA